MPTVVKRYPRFWRSSCWQNATCDLYCDEKVSYNGEGSCYFAQKGAESGARGYMLQTMGAAEYRGKRLQFTGKIKVKSLEGKVALFLKVLDAVPEVVLEDLMPGRELTCVGDWQELSIVIDIPFEARYINFGACVQGNGAIWISDLLVSEVGTDGCITECTSADTKLDAPANLDLKLVDPDTNLPFAWRFNSSDSHFKSAIKQQDNRQSLWIFSDADLVPNSGERSSAVGKFTQKFGCINWRNQKVRFSADMKWQNVGDWCGLMMWVTGVHGKVLRFSTMYDLRLGGDADWQPVTCVLDVPALACNIILALTLNGNGEVYFSNLSFDIAAPDEPTTDMQTGPKNLNFAD